MNSSDIKDRRSFWEVVIVPVAVLSPSEQVLVAWMQLGIKRVQLGVQVVHGECATQLLLVSEDLSEGKVGPEHPLGEGV